MSAVLGNHVSSALRIQGQITNKASKEQVVIALNHRVSAARSLKRFDAALLDCERLISLADTCEAQVSALASRALVYSELRQWDEAIGDCDAATLLFPPSSLVATTTPESNHDSREGSMKNKNQNLIKLGRLKEWITAQKEQETVEATEQADRMARLLIAEVDFTYCFYFSNTHFSLSFPLSLSKQQNGKHIQSRMF